MDRSDDNRPTTADLVARRRREAGEEATQPVRAPAGTAAAVADQPEQSPFFDGDEGARFRALWQEIQTAFVDDPRRAVEQADRLVAQVVERLVDVFADERSRLEGQWTQGREANTEDLRVALQRYRSFFGRLLAM
ncbi:MAG TPA: hypothetical protein VFO85_02335 [Vicinamibacteria bacterium]|nr:hypothetical protein [Vicinamibacteria bacterium]